LPLAWWRIKDMLFLLNKTQPDTIRLLKLLGGEEEKEVLLVEDAVFYATAFIVEKLQTAGVERVYAAEDAVESRAIELSTDCEVLNYDQMVDLIMESDDKLICI
jgi:sulfur relay protein TusB/DsrH